MKHGSRIQRPSVFQIVLALVLATTVITPAGAQEGTPVPGEFLGADLITEDAATAAAFYSELFGWDIEKIKDGEYAIKHKGRLIASVSSIQNDAKVSRSFWLVGMAVPDLDVAVKAATAGGAEVYESIRTVQEYGRIAVIGDPQNAPLMLIEPGSKRIGGTTGPGSWAWSEFWTDDPPKAAAFYRDVLGYEVKKIERNESPYGVFHAGGKNLAGLVKIPDDFENVRPGWAPYVGVADVKQAMAKVKDLGGRVVLGVQETSGARVGLILDPAGAALFLYEIGTYQGEK